MDFSPGFGIELLNKRGVFNEYASGEKKYEKE